MRGASLKGFWKDHRGYTLPEVLTAVAIAGVVAAVSLVILLALLERWRVEAAADQLAADMRLAHANATQQLTDWRLVLMPDGRPLAACSNAVPAGLPDYPDRDFFLAVSEGSSGEARRKVEVIFYAKAAGDTREVVQWSWREAYE